MTLLKWEDDFSNLASSFSEGRIRVLLDGSRLSLPRLGELPASRIKCSTLVEVGGEEGLGIEAQGTTSASVMFHALRTTMPDRPYVISGTDADGGKWKIRDNRLHTSARFHTNGATYHLSPNYTDVTSRVFSDVYADHIEIALPADVRMPALHQGGVAFELAASEGPGSYVDGDFDVEHKVGGAIRIVRMRRVHDLLAFTQAERLLEAISFINGRQVYPLLIRRVERGLGVLSIFRRRTDHTSHALPPVEFGSRRARSAAWLAVIRYFQFCRNVGPNKKPLLSQCVSELQGAYRGLYSRNQALGSAVAVEGLVSKFVREDLAPGWPRNKRERWKRWINRANLPADVAERFKSAVGFAAHPSTAALLRGLSRARLVREADARTWAENRPRLAHSRSGSGGAQDIDALFNSVNIFHSLALALIDFSGPFKLYSRDGGGEGAARGRPNNIFRVGMR